MSSTSKCPWWTRSRPSPTARSAWRSGSDMPVRVIGAGLAGAAAAHLLHKAGRSVEVLEADPTWGGQLRTATAGGILYEPAGAHIFHTSDTEVWELVTGLVEMLPYRHAVRTE